VSLDAYRIRMSNTIFQVRAIDSGIQNACILSGGTSPYCGYYVRTSPTSFPILLLGYNVNIASQDTYGADIEGDYASRFLSHAYSLRLLLNWQPHNYFNEGPLGTVEMGDSLYGGPAGVGPSPSLRGTFIGKFDITNDLSFTVLEKWRNSMRATGNVTIPGVSGATTPVYAIGTVPGVAYTNLTLSYTLHRGAASVELYGNVQNLFNTFSSVPVGGAPSGTPGRGIAPLPIGDDPIGRYMQVGFRLRM
jgi:outer membrane receptor protein involved in Fe transport